MAYFLGIDLGTTYTAAARWQDGRATIARLGSHAAPIPSVVLLREDGEVITGEAAERRSLIEPQRVAREFKRRIGDPTPMFLDGKPHAPEKLMATLLRWVVDRVAADEGGRADGIAVSHPANWGEYKKDLLREAIRLADLPDATLVTEPEAAAIHYASQERIEPGSVIAVYDLGGGTFDAAVLRRTGVGWEILGQPEGIERLGGVDFDAAVLAHVAKTIGPAYDALDPEDPPVLAAAARLRQECVSAKEALTGDTDTSIPVLLPSVQTDVRLNRGEFEAMIRPAVNNSIAALERALRAAGVTADEVGSILLVGGSSRIPLVGELVSSTLGRPVAIDVHPKHGVALGAAIVAAQDGQERISSGVHAVLPESPAEGYAAFAASPPAATSTPRPNPAVDPGAGYRVPALAGAGAAGPGGASSSGGPGDDPQRPALALLVGGAAMLVAVVLVAMLLVGGNNDGGDNTDLPDASPTTVPGDVPGPAAISQQPDVDHPPTTIPGLPTTLPPGVATTLGPHATSTTVPQTTTSTPATTTTLPPTTTTEPPPTTIEPPVTTVPPQARP
ncbi:MAG TPA: Hsp70 family protein [Acidimicrobiales bacterium]|nr:Hsp70 family protein [Acidimicrobiales bacterium]